MPANDHTSSARQLTVDLDAPDGFARYLLGFVTWLWGIRFVPAGGGQRPDIAYGTDLARPAGLRVPRVERYNAESIPAPRAVPATAAGSNGADAVFPFDLFAACRFWLADEANADAAPGSFDRHDRLLGEGSAQGRLGVLEVPPVNAYLLCFREALRARFGVEPVPHLPHGRKAIVVLSHDADSPIDPSDPTHALWRAAAAARRLDANGAARHSASAVVRTVRRLRGNDVRHWLFDEVLDTEDRHGVRSTTFFSARTASDRSGTVFDENYDVADPRFRPVFQRLAGDGWGVGLHSSYEARRNPRLLVDERALLERAVGQSISGNRHHYWHMRRPFWRTLRDHGRAGFMYDSSVAFNEVPGFRLGIALPFVPWAPDRSAVVNVVQVPTMVMDGGYFYRPGQTAGETLSQFAVLLRRLKDAEGVAAVNWHTRMAWSGSAPFGEWGRAYEGIVEMLATDPEVEVMSFEQLMASNVGPAAPAAWVSSSPGDC